MENKLYISMYHYTRDLKNSRYPEIKGLDYTLFEQQLEYFKKNFNVVTMEEVIEAAKGNSKLPQNALLLTFDDGYIDNFTVAMPLLMKYGFQGSFFIPAKTFIENKILDVNKIHFILAVTEKEKRTKELVNDICLELDKIRLYDSALPTNEDLYKQYGIASRFDNADTIFCKRVLQTAIDEKYRNEITKLLFAKYVGVDETTFAKELYLNKDQIRCMKKNGMFIGLHGYDHYWLGNLNNDEMERDIDLALEHMKEFIDINSWVMNYPYGSYNDNVIDYIKSKGCVLGLSTEVRLVDLQIDNVFALPRFDCNDFPPKSERYKTSY